MRWRRGTAAHTEHQLLTTATTEQKLEEILRHHLAHRDPSHLGVLESIAEQPEIANGLQPKEIAVLLLGPPAGLALRQRLQPDGELPARLTGPVAHDYLQRLLGA